MKAKIYRFIFSSLLILLSLIGKGQTVDGKLYTNFSNWYQWSGGKFINNLNIPKLTATSGRDTGGIRYALADSSVYVWTGSQWRAVGGGAIPTLQQVTTAGNITTDSIISRGFIIDGVSSDFSIAEDGVGSGRIALKNRDGTYSLVRLGNQLSFINSAGNATTIVKSTTAATYTTTLPDTTGNLSVGVAANGTTYMAGTNGITNIGNTDTATVVKAYVTNAEAVTITKGQVVYIFGAQGDRASVKLAKNTSDTFSSKTLGIVMANIAAGQAGWITTQGQVSGINLSAYSPGDILWLDSVAGGFTKNKPQAPKHSVFVGVVERANAGNGLIYVKPQNGQELGELHDTKITSPTNNQVLAYTAATDIWENKNVTTALGYTPLNVTDTAAMLTPYLRKRDSVTISKITNASAIARNKYQELCEFVPLSTFAGEIPIGGCSFFDGGGVTSVAGATESGIYGLINLTTTTATTQTGYLIHGTADLLLDTDTMKQEFRFKINNLSDSTGGTSVYNMYVGNSASLNTTTITNGFGILYNRVSANFTGSNSNTQWQLFSASGSNRTFVSSGINVTTGWHRATLLSTSSKIIGYIDDVYIGEITNNIPTAALHPIFNIRNVSGTLRTIGIDFYTADKNYNTSR
jgi:hypothetical protein